MNTLLQRIITLAHSTRLGILAFALASLTTILVLSLPQSALSLPANGLAAAEPGDVQIAVKPSQTKFVQGGAGTMYLDVSIKAPKLGQQSGAQRATDMVVVLDRSGSMAGENKMAYAKAAIQDVLARLDEHDRFALVSFSDQAVVDAPLQAVDAVRRESLTASVNNIVPSGGTNIGDGLNLALALLAENGGERARKVLLLSDGQANQGITQPEALAQIAAQLTQRGAVLSTIGMGLEFNETLMAQLADHGMGHYAFLEDLAGLGPILNEDLHATRSLYASASSLEIALGDGVKLLDAGGYPLSQEGAATVRIATGQLLAGAEKHFTVSLSVPTQNTGTFALGNMRLDYRQQERNYRTLVDAGLQLAVVAPEQHQEAVGSIDNEVYKQSWLKNNLGLMQKQLSQWVREGKKEQAKRAISDYRSQMQAAEAASNVPLASPAVAQKLEAMDAQVDDAFRGGQEEQAQKQKRAAKTVQLGAIKDQRSN